MTVAVNFPLSKVNDADSNFQLRKVNDTGGKFATGEGQMMAAVNFPLSKVNDAGGKFATGVNDLGVYLPLVSNKLHRWSTGIHNIRRAYLEVNVEKKKNYLEM